VVIKENIKYSLVGIKINIKNSHLFIKAQFRI